ncbi:MAG: hypothetical protein ACE5KV_02755 [Thermoplasmata archaeon]
MDSLDIYCTISPSGRVHEEYKVVGVRDTGDSRIPELEESDKRISSKVRDAFGRCVRRTRRHWIFRCE